MLAGVHHSCGHDFLVVLAGTFPLPPALPEGLTSFPDMEIKFSCGR